MSTMEQQGSLVYEGISWWFGPLSLIQCMRIGITHFTLHTKISENTCLQIRSKALYKSWQLCGICWFSAKKTFCIHCIMLIRYVCMYRFFISLDAHCEAEHQSSAATKCIFSDSPCLVLRIIVHQSGKQRVMCVRWFTFQVTQRACSTIFQSIRVKHLL
jgi:hypothetical protein